MPYDEAHERREAAAHARARNRKTAENLVHAGWPDWGPAIFLEVIHMADQVQQLRDDVAALTEAVNGFKQSVAESAAQFQAVIDDLKAHPAAPDLTQPIADLESATAALKAIPVPGPTPAP
jgi:hypothetical protein